MILIFARGSRKTVMIGLERSELKSILDGKTVQTGNEEMTALVGPAALIMSEVREGSKRHPETKIHVERRR